MATEVAGTRAPQLTASHRAGSPTSEAELIVVSGFGDGVPGGTDARRRKALPINERVTAFMAARGRVDASSTRSLSLVAPRWMMRRYSRSPSRLKRRCRIGLSMAWPRWQAMARRWRSRDTVSVMSISARSRPMNAVPSSALSASATAFGRVQASTGRPAVRAAARAAWVARSWSGWPVTPPRSKTSRWLGVSSPRTRSTWRASCSSGTELSCPSG
jgi:hypothetical protein